MFRDIELKINYHKENIIKSFINRGIFPDNRLIQSQLNNIETRLSIFKNPMIKEGSFFNADEMNKSINAIYNDLVILYKLLEEITIKEFNKLDYYIDSHLRELNEVSSMYLKRAELESYSTALGKSIFFKHNSFDLNRKDTFTEINLGEIEIEDATKVACLSSINNTESSNIVFRFDNEGSVVLCNAYNYNRDTVIFPGEKKTQEFITKVNDNQKVNGTLELPIVVSNANNSSFITLAGKDKILYKKANESGEVIEEKPVAINALSFTDHSYIDFYVIGGTSITFRFNKKPIATNFNMNSNKIENLNYIHHFFIECDKDFSFDFELEKGAVYAIKEKTLVEQDSLYYSGQIDIKDFLIVQTLPGEKRKYKTVVEIHGEAISEDDIESIMIKRIE